MNHFDSTLIYICFSYASSMQIYSFDHYTKELTTTYELECLVDGFTIRLDMAHCSKLYNSTIQCALYSPGAKLYVINGELQKERGVLQITNKLELFNYYDYVPQLITFSKDLIVVQGFSLILKDKATFIYSLSSNTSYVYYGIAGKDYSGITVFEDGLAIMNISSSGMLEAKLFSIQKDYYLTFNEISLLSNSTVETPIFFNQSVQEIPIIELLFGKKKELPFTVIISKVKMLIFFIPLLIIFIAVFILEKYEEYYWEQEKEIEMRQTLVRTLKSIKYEDSLLKNKERLSYGMSHEF